MPKDKELADHERAHNGQPGSDVKHGASATQTRYSRTGPSKGDKKKMYPSGDPENGPAESHTFNGKRWVSDRAVKSGYDRFDHDNGD